MLGGDTANIQMQRTKPEGNSTAMHQAIQRRMVEPASHFLAAIVMSYSHQPLWWAHSSKLYVYLQFVMLIY